jgi:hypothetical protein
VLWNRSSSSTRGGERERERERERKLGGGSERHYNREGVGNNILKINIIPEIMKGLCFLWRGRR